MLTRRADGLLFELYHLTFWLLVCSFDDVIHLTSDVIDSLAILRPTAA